MGMTITRVPGAALAAWALLSAALTPAFAAPDHDDPPTIEVTATAIRRVPADAVLLGVELRVRDTDPKRLEAKMDDRVDAAEDATRGLRPAEGTVTISDPDRTAATAPNQPTVYELSRTVTVRITDFDAFADVHDRLASTLGEPVRVAYTRADLADVKRQALTGAAAAAAGHAVAIAAGLGVARGPAVRVRDVELEALRDDATPNDALAADADTVDGKPSTHGLRVVATVTVEFEVGGE